MIPFLFFASLIAPSIARPVPPFINCTDVDIEEISSLVENLKIENSSEDIFSKKEWDKLKTLEKNLPDGKLKTGLYRSLRLLASALWQYKDEEQLKNNLNDYTIWKGKYSLAGQNNMPITFQEDKMEQDNLNEETAHSDIRPFIAEDFKNLIPLSPTSRGEEDIFFKSSNSFTSTEPPKVRLKNFTDVQWFEMQSSDKIEHRLPEPSIHEGAQSSTTLNLSSPDESPTMNVNYSETSLDIQNKTSLTDITITMPVSNMKEWTLYDESEVTTSYSIYGVEKENNETETKNEVGITIRNHRTESSEINGFPYSKSLLDINARDVSSTFSWKEENYHKPLTTAETYNYEGLKTTVYEPNKINTSNDIQNISTNSLEAVTSSKNKYTTTDLNIEKTTYTNEFLSITTDSGSSSNTDISKSYFSSDHDVNTEYTENPNSLDRTTTQKTFHENIHANSMRIQTNPKHIASKINSNIFENHSDIIVKQGFLDKEEKDIANSSGAAIQWDIITLTETSKSVNDFNSENTENILSTNNSQDVSDADDYSVTHDTTYRISFGTSALLDLSDEIPFLKINDTHTLIATTESEIGISKDSSKISHSIQAMNESGSQNKKDGHNFYMKTAEAHDGTTTGKDNIMVTFMKLTNIVTTDLSEHISETGNTGIHNHDYFTTPKISDTAVFPLTLNNEIPAQTRVEKNYVNDRSLLKELNLRDQYDVNKLSSQVPPFSKFDSRAVEPSTPLNVEYSTSNPKLEFNNTQKDPIKSEIPNNISKLYDEEIRLSSLMTSPTTNNNKSRDIETEDIISMRSPLYPNEIMEKNTEEVENKNKITLKAQNDTGYQPSNQYEDHYQGFSEFGNLVSKDLDSKELKNPFESDVITITNELMHESVTPGEYTRFKTDQSFDDSEQISDIDNQYSTVVKSENNFYHTTEQMERTSSNDFAMHTIIPTSENSDKVFKTERVQNNTSTKKIPESILFVSLSWGTVDNLLKPNNDSTYSETGGTTPLNNEYTLSSSIQVSDLDLHDNYNDKLLDYNISQEAIEQNINHHDTTQTVFLVHNNSDILSAKLNSHKTTIDHTSTDNVLKTYKYTDEIRSEEQSDIINMKTNKENIETEHAYTSTNNIISMNYSNEDYFEATKEMSRNSFVTVSQLPYSDTNKIRGYNELKSTNKTEYFNQMFMKDVSSTQKASSTDYSDIYHNLENKFVPSSAKPTNSDNSAIANNLRKHGKITDTSDFTTNEPLYSGLSRTLNSEILEGSSYFHTNFKIEHSTNGYDHTKQEDELLHELISVKTTDNEWVKSLTPKATNADKSEDVDHKDNDYYDFYTVALTTMKPETDSHTYDNFNPKDTSKVKHFYNQGITFDSTQSRTNAGYIDSLNSLSTEISVWTTEGHVEKNYSYNNLIYPDISSSIDVNDESVIPLTSTASSSSKDHKIISPFINEGHYTTSKNTYKYDNNLESSWLESTMKNMAFPSTIMNPKASLIHGFQGSSKMYPESTESIVTLSRDLWASQSESLENSLYTNPSFFDKGVNLKRKTTIELNDEKLKSTPKIMIGNMKVETTVLPHVNWQELNRKSTIMEVREPTTSSWDVHDSDPFIELKTLDSAKKGYETYFSPIIKHYSHKEKLLENKVQRRIGNCAQIQGQILKPLTKCKYST